MAKRLIPYVHTKTGDVKVVTRSAAKKLDPEYKRVQFVENEEGVRVMRFALEGATVDVSENTPEVVKDGDRSAK